MFSHGKWHFPMGKQVGLGRKMGHGQNILAMGKMKKKSYGQSVIKHKIIIIVALAIMAMYIFCSYNYVKKITFGPWPTKNVHGQICPWPTKSGHGQCGFAHGQFKCSHGQVFMAMAILITLKWAMAI